MTKAGTTMSLTATTTTTDTLLRPPSTNIDQAMTLNTHDIRDSSTEEEYAVQDGRPPRPIESIVPHSRDPNETRRQSPDRRDSQLLGRYQTEPESIAAYTRQSPETSTIYCNAGARPNLHHILQRRGATEDYQSRMEKNFYPVTPRRSGHTE